MRPKRSHKLDKLAKIYDAEILPLWSERFGRLLFRDLALPARANVLDVGCGTGWSTLELYRRIDEQGRIIAIDPSPAMLDVAREKAGAVSGKRIFFRSESAEPKLSFADDVYDVVVANLALHEMEHPPDVVRDLARVAKPGGHLAASLPLAGTFAEFYDLFREVLIKKDRDEALASLEEHLAEQPTAEALRGWFEHAGLTDVVVETERYELVFKSGREFFFAPVVDYLQLPAWKRIAALGGEMQEVFWAAKEAIDAYFSTEGGGSFSVSVLAGVVRGRKPTEDEALLLFARRGADGAPAPVPVEKTETTNAIVIGTSEIDILAVEEDPTAEGETGGGEDPPLF